MKNISINGLPENISDDKAALFRSRIIHAYDELKKHSNSDDLPVSISLGKIQDAPKHEENKRNDNDRDNTISKHYIPTMPSYTFEQLILQSKVHKDITTAIQLLKVESLIFDKWGLRSIEPNPKVAINFYGKPGTGKTLAAHAIANFLGKKILLASYAEIESKYHGDGPKNVKAIFQAAEREDALLFIDEADSLLSKRLTNVSQGSEQAINSMRSQLLINLELFHGIVIFSTNLVQNYDKAFETRVQHIEFLMPDENGRYHIWKKHLPPELPLADDVSCEKLAKDVEDICGRDIKNAVIQSAVKAALEGSLIITHHDLFEAITKIKESRIKEAVHAELKPISAKEKEQIEKKLSRSIGTMNMGKVEIETDTNQEGIDK